MSETRNGKRAFVVREAQSQDLAPARTLIVDVLTTDLKTGVVPAWHADLDSLQTTYLDHPRQALFVAVDSATQDIIGTTAIRTGGPNHPPHPQWLTERYAGEHVAQLFRVYIASSHRRRGVARALVEAARKWVACTAGYTVIYLHTNPDVPGAEAFWRSMSTSEIYDDRGTRTDGGSAIHFELALPTSRIER